MITEVIVDLKKYCCELDEKQQNFRLNCHIFCRALESVIQDVKVVDGHYFGINWLENGSKVSLARCDHSWLKTKDGSIIDIYPVGFIAMAPILVASTGDMARFGKSMYVEDPKITKEVVNRDLYRNVRVIQKHLTESIKITKARFNQK